MEPFGRSAGTPKRQRYSNFKTKRAACQLSARVPHLRQVCRDFLSRRARDRDAAARMLNSITNMGKKTKKKAAPPPPPLNSGQRVRYQSQEGFVSKIKGDAYEIALDGGRVVQATRNDLEPIHRRLSTKQPSNKLSSGTRSSTELDYKGTNFEDFPDEALPLIEVSDDKEVLKVNEEAVELLRRIDCAICPISIVGLYRTGKSSLLNFLHGGKAGFRTGHSVSRCTRGVWIYGRPTRATLGDGTQVAVVLLDTEGVGGLEADRRYDERIFALATLLSATLVYNSLGSIDENAIGQLSFVAQLSRHVRFAPKDEAVGDDGDEAEEDARRWRGGVRSAADESLR